MGAARKARAGARGRRLGGEDVAGPAGERLQRFARVDFAALAEKYASLRPFLKVFPANGTRKAKVTYSFQSSEANVALCQALLDSTYNIKWTLPSGFLCPAVPSRLAYVCAIADLLREDVGGAFTPRGLGVCGLDVGVGANCIYPLLCHAEFAWRMVGSDVSEASLAAARANAAQPAPWAPDAVQLRRQPCATRVFAGVVRDADRFAFSMCNPPFHAAAAEANVNPRRTLEAAENEIVFAGGGELAFIQLMMAESASVCDRILWFTTLVAKHSHLKVIGAAASAAKVLDYRQIELRNGKHTRWVIAWSFTLRQQRENVLRFVANTATEPDTESNELPTERGQMRLSRRADSSLDSCGRAARGDGQLRL